MAETSSAESMDDIYRVQRHFYDLTRRYYLLGRMKLIKELDTQPHHTVLEVGCGTAWNLIKTARLQQARELCGFDISNMMLKTAQSNIDRKGLSKRIRLAQGDAGDYSAEAMFGIPTFDRIILSYTLSMIPPWREAIAASIRNLSPHGSIHIVDFGQCSELPASFKSGLYKWLDKFQVTPRANLETECRAQAEAAGLQVEWQPLYRGYANYAVLSANT